MKTRVASAVALNVLVVSLLVSQSVMAYAGWSWGPFPFGVKRLQSSLLPFGLVIPDNYGEPLPANSSGIPIDDYTDLTSRYWNRAEGVVERKDDPPNTDWYTQGRFYVEGGKTSVKFADSPKWVADEMWKGNSGGLKAKGINSAGDLLKVFQTDRIRTENLCVEYKAGAYVYRTEKLGKDAPYKIIEGFVPWCDNWDLTMTSIWGTTSSGNVNLGIFYVKGGIVDALLDAGYTDPKLTYLKEKRNIDAYSYKYGDQTQGPEVFSVSGGSSYLLTTGGGVLTIPKSVWNDVGWMETNKVPWGSMKGGEVISMIIPGQVMKDVKDQPWGVAAGTALLLTHNYFTGQGAAFEQPSAGAGTVRYLLERNGATADVKQWDKYYEDGRKLLGDRTFNDARYGLDWSSRVYADYRISADLVKRVCDKSDEYAKAHGLDFKLDSSPCPGGSIVQNWLRGDLTAIAMFSPLGNIIVEGGVTYVKVGDGSTRVKLEPYMVKEGHVFANQMLDYLTAHPDLDSYWGVSLAEFVAWGFERSKALEASDPKEAANLRDKSQKLWDQTDAKLKSLDPNALPNHGIQWGNPKILEPNFMDIGQWTNRGWAWNPTTKRWDFKGLALQWDLNPTLWKSIPGKTTPIVANPTTTTKYIGTTVNPKVDPLMKPDGDSYSKWVDDATAAFQNSLDAMKEAKETVGSALQDPINREIKSLLDQGAYTSAEIVIREALDKHIPLDMLVNVRVAAHAFTLLVSSKSAPARGAGNELHRKLGDNFYAISRRALRVLQARLLPMSMVGTIQVPAPIGLEIDLLWPITVVLCFMVLLIAMASSAKRGRPRARGRRHFSFRR